MYSSFGKSFSFVRLGCLALCLGILAACADGAATGGAGTSQAAATPAPDYVTFSDQFVELQSAGLRGDYPGFAKALKATESAKIIADLTRSFGGGPFDVYTRNAKQDNAQHRRAVELRSTSGRLYLFVEMRKVPGGWIVSGHELDRKRALIMARL